MKKKIAVLMSGGVDSSYAAWFLKTQGHPVCGLTFKIPYLGEEGIKRAAGVCCSLGIPHYTIDITERFKSEIVDYFVTSYLNGYTPNPCVRCNERIKFDALLQEAQTLNCDLIASGHYAGIMEQDGVYFLLKGTHDRKSQEYFLALLPQKLLSRIVFPLYGHSKEQVTQAVSRWYPYPIEESQEVCFIREKSYREFIEAHVPDHARYAGTIRHKDGRPIGTHAGIYAYTYGQRDGLGISWSEPLYVTDIDAAHNEVVVSERSGALQNEFIVRDINWFYPPRDYTGLTVKMRYNARFLECAIFRIEGKRLTCVLTRDQDIPSPGQCAVFYDNDAVVAGGIIEKS